MTTIDLGTAPIETEDIFGALPRRVALTLPELQLASSYAGGAPLPFDVTDPGPATELEGRLGQTPAHTEDDAYRQALASLHDPRGSLQRRGLLKDSGLSSGLDKGLDSGFDSGFDSGLDAGIAGALGLLATPAVALEVDVTIAGTQARAWHRQSGDAVATLATVDGIVFELAWFHSAVWSGELARIPVLPEDHTLRPGALPRVIDLPYELFDAAGEALRSGRGELVAVLVSQHSGGVFDASGKPVDDTQVAALLSTLTSAADGRLRVLVARTDGEGAAPIGVVSWVLLSQGWYAIRAYPTPDRGDRVEVRAVEAADLPGDLAPVLAEVNA